jgi:hypothetical protein
MAPHNCFEAEPSGDSQKQLEAAVAASAPCKQLLVNSPAIASRSASGLAAAVANVASALAAAAYYV